jgi:hypothetical protein
VCRSGRSLSEASPHVMDGIRVARKRVLRLMRENALLSPHRARTRDDRPHDRHIVTEAPNLMWATDASVAAASGVRDGGLAPAIGLQEQVANRRKRRGSKARVVSITEKASKHTPSGATCAKLEAVRRPQRSQAPAARSKRTRGRFAPPR